MLSKYEQSPHLFQTASPCFRDFGMCCGYVCWYPTRLTHPIPGFPKLTLSMYPFSISIDENVPLNMSAGKIVFEGGAKIFLQGGGKSSKITFSPLETKKTIFFAKKLMGKCQTSKSWGGFIPPPSDTHAPKTSYDKKAEEDNKNIFTNKHIVIFENNIHGYLF